MPATTTSGIPYPLDTDKVSDYPAVAKQAAEAVDALLAGGQSLPITAEKNIAATPQGAVGEANTVSVTTTGGVLLITVRGRFTATGPGYGHLFPLVDGAIPSNQDHRIYCSEAHKNPLLSFTFTVPVTRGTHTVGARLTADIASPNALYLDASTVSVTEVR